MSTVLAHLVFGTAGAFAVFVALARLAGERSFSAPLGAVLVGVTCAVLAHFASPWATPAVLLLLVAAGLVEVTADRRRRPPP